MKFKLQSLMLFQIISLLLITVIALSLSSYYFSQNSAEQFEGWVLRDTGRDVYTKIHLLVNAARTRHAYESLRISAETPTSADFPRLTRSWLRALETQSELAFIGLALENGESIGVARASDHRPYIREWRFNGQTGKFTLNVFSADNYPGHPQFTSNDGAVEALEQRPWLRAARQAKPGEQIWTPCYGFPGERGAPGVPGAACVSRFHAENGKPVGVLAVGVDVFTLCDYLKSLNVGKQGFAFVAELHPDGKRTVVACPKPEVVWRVVDDKAEAEGRENVPIADIADPCVRAFMALLPAHIPTDDGTGFVPIEFLVDGDRYVGGYEYIRGADTPEWVVCTVLPQRDIMENVWRNNAMMLGIGVIVLVAAILVTVCVSRHIAKPLANVVSETKAIAKFDCDPRPVISSPVQEIVALGVALEEMKKGLRSFRKYVPADIVRELLQSKRTAVLGGASQHLTIFFCDVVDFTMIAERLSPNELVDHLREYLAAMSACVMAESGTVDKYIGDAIMAFWGAPNYDRQHAWHACKASVRCQQRLAELRTQWEKQDKPQFAARIGLNTGEVVVGNIGSETRLNYTVIGDAVNLASRLEGLNKVYGTEIIISENTYREAAEKIVARPIDWIAVKGKSQPVLAYELLGLTGEVTSDIQELVQMYAEGLARYGQQQWEQAIALFRQIERLRPGDKPSCKMIDRCHHYQKNPPGDDWDASHQVAG